MRFEDIENKDGFYITTQIIGSTFQDSNTKNEIDIKEKFGIFFIVDKPCQLLYVQEIHTVAGSGKLNIEKLSGIDSLDMGDELLATDFDLNAPMNTVQSSNYFNDNLLYPGDRLALKDKGTLVNTQNICITLYLKPLGKGDYR